MERIPQATGNKAEAAEPNVAPETLLAQTQEKSPEYYRTLKGMVAIEGYRKNPQLKSNGKYRPAYDPEPATRQHHDAVINRCPPLQLPSQLACVAKHLDNGSRYYFKLDIENAFGNVDTNRLVTMLNEAGVATDDLDEHFFHPEGGIIQGATSSPYLFEFYCRQSGLDADLDAYINKLNNDFPGERLVWTRYADDIVISKAMLGDEEKPFGRKIGPTLRRLLEKHGFTYSEDKALKRDTTQQPITILGAVIQDGKARVKTEVTKRLTEGNLPKAVHNGLQAWHKEVQNLNDPKLRSDLLTKYYG